MTKEEYNKIVKEEGDYMEFEAFGLSCVIRRVEELGHWCGYVGVEKENRLYGMDYYTTSESELGISEIEKAINNIDVHGGITFAGLTFVDNLAKDRKWYFGFDCAHFNDLTSFNIIREKTGVLSGTYKTKNYVIKECKKLAWQLKEIDELKK